MINFIMTLLLAGAGNQWAQPTVQAHNVTVQMDVRAGTVGHCRSEALHIPIPAGGLIRFDAKGYHYEGAATGDGRLMMRGDGAQPLLLTGQETTGGLWSRGVEGHCGGTWRPTL